MPKKTVAEQINGDANNPTFTTESGLVLRLRHVPLTTYRRWGILYEKRHPAPPPPVRILSNGDEYADHYDATYQALRDDWKTRKAEAETEFVIEAGVLTDVPKGWEHPFGLPVSKVVWLEEILTTAEANNLMHAILGLNQATSAGIEEAEKK